jgi:hypothetical protein
MSHGKGKAGAEIERPNDDADDLDRRAVEHGQTGVFGLAGGTTSTAGFRVNNPCLKYDNIIN